MKTKLLHAGEYNNSWHLFSKIQSSITDTFCAGFMLIRLNSYATRVCTMS